MMKRQVHALDHPMGGTHLSISENQILFYLYYVYDIVSGCPFRSGLKLLHIYPPSRNYPILY